MITQTFNHIKGKVVACCGLVVAVVLRNHRHREGEENGKGEGVLHCEINCDLSDKRTFFAWQRNHMANERTFLAWCRTGISLIVFSFVIERFDLLIQELRIFSVRPQMAEMSHKTHYMGIVSFGLGAFIIVLAGWRFFYIRRLINRAETDFSALPDIILMGSVLATVVLTFLFMFFLL